MGQTINQVIKKWGLTAKTVALILGKSTTTIPVYRKAGAKVPAEVRLLADDLDKKLSELKDKYQG